LVFLSGNKDPIYPCALDRRFAIFSDSKNAARGSSSLPLCLCAARRGGVLSLPLPILRATNHQAETQQKEAAYQRGGFDSARPAPFLTGGAPCL